ncbi:hypothetical protein MF672_013680 [Actinomadura sp. ATCC 31491]|uniref:Uncharacterized protein n=1 Tax=Actinomadura luzonensis TaxID=2805427 RepID=A0ABT0FR95_9ACTN|nr:hypothetical protein [Actinomadura luzonensis]MCK2214834.1 hypothetical protein [Actinomadura luzonensis]
MTDAKPPGRLRPAHPEQVAGGTGTGRDTAGGAPGPDGTGGAASDTGGAVSSTGVGTAGARGAHARMNPAAELGFSGDPGQHGDHGDELLHAQRIWDGALATNRLDDAGVNAERQRVETKDVTAAVSLLVDGWPADVRACVESLLEHTRAKVLAFDLGDVDGAGDVLDELAARDPERVAVWHVAERPHWRGGTATWGESRAKLLRLDESDVHVLMETTVALRGDALTPLLAAIAEGATAAGWQGVDLYDDGPREAGPGRVQALTGEVVAVRRQAALGALPEDAHWGRNADLALSLGLRGELVVPEGPAPVARLGAHDVPAGYADQESRRNYDGVLRLLSARTP